VKPKLGRGREIKKRHEDRIKEENDMMNKDFDEENPDFTPIDEEAANNQIAAKKRAA
jgi:hypothetical protein